MSSVRISDPGRYGSGPEPVWRDLDASAIERTIDAGGARVNLVDTGGDGPPIVFLHGHSASWQHWLEQIPVFRGAGHRVVAIDHPGFGLSPLEAAGISITRYAEVVDAVLGELGIARAPIVGNSMGGFIGAELAHRFPQRVERLVLVSAAGLSDRYVGIRNEWFSHPRGERVAGGLFGGPTLSEGALRRVAARRRSRVAAMAWIVTHADQLCPRVAWEVLRGIGRPGGPAALQACVTYDFRDELASIDCPTLIVWGEKDVIVRHSGADEYAAAIAGSRIVRYTDTGHLPMLERPERFNADVREFLAAAPATRPATAEVAT